MEGEGMTYKDVTKRLKRIEKTQKEGKVKNSELKKRLTNSLRNQLRLREGEGAVKEAVKESLSFGLGSRGDVFVGGFGNGKKGLCDGWKRVDPGHYQKVY
jgi:hypothetical protein